MTEAPGSALVVELASDTQIRMTRMLNAPRALVFETRSTPMVTMRACRKS